MADAQYGEGRSFNLHSAGTDLVEGSALAVKSSSGAIAVDGITIGSVNAMYVAAQGDVAHDAVDSGNPVKIGGIARVTSNSSGQTAVSASGDRVNASFDLVGKMGVFIGDPGANDNAQVGFGGDHASGTAGKGLWVNAYGHVYDGTNYKIARGDASGSWVHGPTAADAAIAAAPITVGARASTATPTAMSADGDVVNLWASLNGALNVTLRDTSGAYVSVGGGTQYVGDAAATSTPTGTMSMGLANSAAPTNVSANNDAVALWANQSGSLNVVLRDTSGSALATGTQFAEDDALTGTSIGTAIIGKRVDTLSTVTPVANDAVIARLDARGAMWVTPDGNVAHDSVDSGNPIKIGGYASTSVPTSVSSGDRVNALFTVKGSMVASPLVSPISNDTTSIGLAPPGSSLLLDGSFGILGAMAFNYDGTNLVRPRTFNAYTTAAATPEIGILAAGQPDKRYTSVSLGTAVAATQVWDAMGVDTFMFYVGTSTTGTFIFEVSPDGTNYVSAEVRDVVLDTWLSGTNVTPTSGKVYRVITNNWRSVRVRTVTALGATVAFTATSSPRSTVINAIDTGPAPHSFGYTPVNYTATYTSAQTSTAIESNSIGATQRLVVTSIQIQSYGTTAGTCVVYFGTGAYSRGTNAAVFDGEFAPSSTLKPGFAQTWSVNAPIGAVDEEIRITTTNAQSVTVNVWGYIVG